MVRLAALGLGICLAGCVHDAGVGATGTASVPLTEREHSGHDEETNTRDCKVPTDCGPPLVCCFAAPTGEHLSSGYCATAEICAAVANPPP